MNKIKKIFLWLGLLNKRLLHKISFWIILCCIPLLVIGVNLMSKQESGILTIVLCREGGTDELAEKVTEQLMEHGNAIRFLEVESTEEAGKLVQSGKADAAWIFPEEFEECLKEYLTSDYSEGGVIKILEKEDNVALHLSREIFFGELYSDISYVMYEHFVTERLLAGENVSEQELWESYDYINNDENMFVLSFLDGEEAEVDMSYMLFPVRGLLALLIVLCGMALGLYFLQDEERGVFTWMPLNQSVWGSWLYLLPGLFDVGLVVLVGLLFSGNFNGWMTEIGLLLLYLLMVAGFSDVLRRICGKPVRLAALIPLLLLTMLVVCPIFMGAPDVKWLQLLLPPYYYLSALHNGTYAWFMLVYVVVIYLVDWMLLKAGSKRKL